MPHPLCAVSAAAALSSLAACRPADRNLDLRGVWAPTRSDQASLVEFTSAGAWEVIEEGDDLCGWGLFDSWACDGPGEWRAQGQPDRYKEEFELVISFADGDEETLTAWFRGGRRFCWEPPFAESKCWHRIAYP